LSKEQAMKVMIQPCIGPQRTGTLACLWQYAGYFLLDQRTAQ
jgi:hypothetical protein